jgi:hypothetical protein
MRPVVNPVLEGVHGISQLEEVAARKDPPSILQEYRAFYLPLLLLPGSLLPLQRRRTTGLKPGSADGSQTSDEGAQQARNRTRHDGRIAGW